MSPAHTLPALLVPFIWGLRFVVIKVGIAWAIGSVLSKRFRPFEPLKLIVPMSLFTVPRVMAASLALEHGQVASLRAAGAVAWPAFADTVLFGAVAGCGLWFWLIASCPISRLASFALLQTVSAIAAGAAILREPLTPTLIAGAAICIAGVAASQSRPGTRDERHAARSIPIRPSEGESL